MARLEPERILQELLTSVLLECESLLLLQQGKSAIGHERLGNGAKEEHTYCESKLVCLVPFHYLLQKRAIIVNWVQGRPVGHK